jgi:hypothetical protein
MSSSAMQIDSQACQTPGGVAHRSTDLPLRRRLLSRALASVVASRGRTHMPDEAVFEAMSLRSMVASASDPSLDRAQRDDVVAYLASLGAHDVVMQRQVGISEKLHEETCLALKPSLICMRWPGKTS